METTLEHGEFLDILNHGVLITGAAGIGKSTVALELLDRGHRLIADDVVLFRKQADRINGHCPELLQNYLTLRDLGVLDVQALYGPAAIASSARLDLVIRLVDAHPPRAPGMSVITTHYTLLEVAFPEIQILATANRNLALVIETAVKNHILYRQGNDANLQFIAEQQRSI